MNKTILYPLLALALGFGLAFIIATNEPELSVQSFAPTPTTVRVMRAQVTQQYLTIDSQGSVQPSTQSELIPEVSGRAVWLSPSLVSGGAFHAGDVLLRIDDADYRTQLQRAEATLQRSQVEHEHAQDELERLVSLQQRQLASQQLLDDARRRFRVAEANLLDARASSDQARRDLARTELIAPFDGLVRSEHVDLGQFIPRGTSIAVIYATDFVEVRLPISADQMQYLGLPVDSRGLLDPAVRPPVTVAADFGDTRLLWEGELVRLEAEIDERSRLLYGVARLQIDDNAETPFLPVGMFVQAEIRGQRADAVVRLPRSAMRDNNQVLVVDTENRLRFRQVSLLRLEHDDILVSEGLAEGELVCISPLQTVVDGMHVNPVFE
ncbi:MAG: efflux RND transporter periplasmic adaptor subunit [Halioglobus sp.]